MSVLRLRKVRGGVVLVAALLGGPLFAVGMLATSAPASAADAPSPPDKGSAGPELAIGIDDGHTSIDVGDHVTYTVKIRNIGTAAADDLAVTQTLPAGARFGSADHDGVVKDGTVTWHTDLAAGRDTALVVQAEVTKPQAGQLRLASVACATINGDSRPIVCAADSDKLPAGAGAHSTAPGSAASSGPRGWLLVLYVGIGVGAALALLAGLVGRRRWSSRSSTRTRGSSHRPEEPDREGDREEAQVPNLR